MTAQAVEFTLDEQIIAEFSKALRGEVIAGNGSGSNLITAAIALAKLTHAPDILISAGWSPIIVSKPVRLSLARGVKPDPKTIEGKIDLVDIFQYLQWGKRHMVMGTSQIDQYGNTNISCIGNWNKPSNQLIGARGCPGNTINHTISYWIGYQTKTVFIPRVDFISGVGYAGGPENTPKARKFHHLEVVATNLGFFDFDEKTGRMRIKSYNKGSSVQKMVENTGFELIIPPNVKETPAPTPEQLRLIREVIDPLGVRRLEMLPPQEASVLRKEIMAKEKELVAAGR